MAKLNVTMANIPYLVIYKIKCINLVEMITYLFTDMKLSTECSEKLPKKLFHEAF